MGALSRLIGYPLGWIMWLVYVVCKNYAISIVIFTLITKIILFPLSVKQQKNSAAMAAFSPKLEKLKKQYANNPQKLQEAQMELYAEEDINPMASCLPLFIQLPILYGVFDVVYRPITHIIRCSKDVIAKATEICGALPYGDSTYAEANKMFSTRPELYILQAFKDPANAEAFRAVGDGFYEQVSNFNNTLFGFIDLSKIPSFSPDVWSKEAIGLVLIPFASGIIQLIMTIYSQIRQKKLNPAADSNAQAMAGMNAMLYIMPIFSVWIAFSYPAGIGFYWTCSSFFSLIQSVILYKIYTPEYVAKLIENDKKKKKKKNKPNMMQRYQEMMAQQNGGYVNTTATVKKNSEDGNDSEVVKLSKSKQKEYELKIIAEARRKQAEKYGDSYDDSEDQ